MTPLERAARWSDPELLTELWEATNGTWMTPRDDELRAFLIALARQIDGVTP